MEVENTTPQAEGASGAAPVTPEAPAAAPDAAQAPAEASPEASPPAAGSPAAQAAAAYTVNPVFKVKNTEKKMDDWLLPAIKTPEQEKALRELHEKAYGLDHVKADRQSLKERLKGYEARFEQEVAPVMQGVQKLNYALQQGNLGAAFDVLNIPKQAVLTWALQYAQMDAQQRAQVDGAGKTALQAFDQQLQGQSYQQQMQAQMAEFRSRELDFTLQRPDVTQAQQAFDSVHGEGAFRNEVIRRGQFYAYQGKDIPAEQAVEEVMRYVPRQSPQAPGSHVPAATPPQAAPSPAAAAQAQQAKPVIPNIQGQGTSPAKRVIGSMADIRKRRKELEAQENG